MDKFLISSKPIEVSEYKDYKLATFLISVLDEYNANGVLIPKEVGEKYHETIVGFPIVAKLITDSDNNPIDFRGHEVTEQRGGYRFNTMPIGSVLKSYIEDRVVEGYEGIKSCIMIQAKLWSSRFPEYFEVLDELWAEGNISSSWELSVEKAEPTIKGKILKAFSFIGNCLLGRDVEGAVNGAGMIEYAENHSDNSDDIKLAKALSIDCLDDKEVKEMEKETVMSETEVVETETVEVVAEETKETVEEITKEVVESSESETIEETISETETVENVEEPVTEVEEVSETENVIAELQNTIAEKDKMIISINAEIESLKSQIAELTEIKTKYDEIIAEREEIEKAEKIKAFREKAISSGYISETEIDTSEEISAIISSLDENKLNALIVERIIKANASSKIEKAETEKIEKININLSSVETETEKTFSVEDCRKAIKSYIQ